MLKTLKVILLVILVGTIYVVLNEVSSYDYIFPEYYIKYDEVPITSVKSVLAQDSITLIPVKYTGIIDFNTIPEDLRKRVFINFMLPPIVIERDRLFSLLQRVEFIEKRMMDKKTIRAEDLNFFKELMEKYDATSLKDLKMKQNLVMPTILFM